MVAISTEMIRKLLIMNISIFVGLYNIVILCLISYITSSIDCHYTHINHFDYIN